MSAKPAVDVDLRKHQVQDLSSPDAVAAFFAGLGWDTSARTPQTPANLGVGAQTLLDQVQHCELIASDGEGWPLEVYLFKLTSLTVAATRGLARAFKNRAGNFLIVLTADYERIDFVLLERFVPEGASPTATVGRKTADIRPRILSVERRNPGKVEMRVLRRFTYTAGDPVAQYDKLVSAYGIAEWSEDHFDNRNLFADYCLSERLPNSNEWKQESPKDAYSELSRLYENAAASWANKTEGELRSGLLEPALRALGFDCAKKKSAKSDEPTPDYILRSPENGKVEIGACLTYPWDRNLDGKDYDRDAETPEENPGAAVVSLLHQDDAEWVIVTNGKHWRLYSPRTHAKATNYYEIDLEETLASPDPQESFRYFWFLFRRQAFESRAIEVDGEEKTTTYLDQLVEDSQSYAKRLGDRLKDRVFDDVFIHLARGFVEHRKAQQGADADLSQEALDDVFHGTLTLLYRLLFLLYAEARDLLPVRNVRDYYAASLKRMKEEIGEAAGEVTDKAEDRLKRAYRADATDLYDRLTGLFRIIDEGEPKVNVPVYNGGLFISKPDAADETAEAENARFLISNKVPDRRLAMALDLLARDEDEKTDKQAFIDYKSLGVRQLGSIYEGLLEFHLRIAPEKMAICKGKKTEEVYPYKEAVRAKRQILKDGRGQNAKERTYRRGDLYLENTRGERKATGSYYTPDYIVKYIVEHTVGPVLEEKFEAVRPRLREAQKAHAAAVKRNRQLEKAEMPQDDPEKVANEYSHVVDELFDIKVLDPAMGSGHFLVEAVDVISDRMIAFLTGFPWNPVTAALSQTRQAILRAATEKDITIDPGRLTDVNLLKRHVLKRCVYGVDLNPMAVELAKVSLWLHCFTLGAPLSFLDHHLKAGNSLIGAREVDSMIVGAKRQSELLHAIANYLQIAATADATADQVTESKRLWQEAEALLSPTKCRLSVDVARHFIDLGSDQGAARIAQCAYSLDGASPEERKLFDQSQAQAEWNGFFHWELEFPEVWYGVRPDTKGVVARQDRGGFDAVVGNPPYANAWRMTDLDDVGRAAIAACAYPRQVLAGHWDLYVPFVTRAANVIAPGGNHAFIVPDAMAREKYAARLREWLSREMTFTRWTHFEGANVFDEVSRHCVVYCVSAGKPGEHTRMIVDQPPTPASAAVASTDMLQSDLLCGSSRQFRVAGPAVEGKPLSSRVTRNCLQLGQYCYVMVGATTHSKDRVSFRKSDIVTLDPRGNAKPFFDGRNVSRYEVSWDGRFIDYRRDEMYGPRVPELYEGPKIIVRDVTDENEHLIVAFDTEKLYCDHTVACVVLYDQVESTSAQTEFEGYPRVEGEAPTLWYTLGVVASELLSWHFRTIFATGTLQGSYSHTYPTQIRAFPIRRPHFTTAASERKRLVKDLRSAYREGRFDGALSQIESLLPKDDEGNFLAFQDGPNWKYDPETKTGEGECPEKSDVVHDFLAFLAEQMIEMNKEKQAEMRRFLGWIEEKLRISPDRQDREGIDALTGKTKLRNYVGDYQKGEEHLSFDELLTILRKNRSRIGAGLSDPAFVERLRTEYEASLAKLLPIKERLAKTDWLIDQVVYRLYGLTEEEIKIVEGGGSQ